MCVCVYEYIIRRKAKNRFARKERQFVSLPKKNRIIVKKEKECERERRKRRRRKNTRKRKRSFRIFDFFFEVNNNNIEHKTATT